MFTHDEFAVTNAVVVIQGGRVRRRALRRRARVLRPPRRAHHESSPLLSWSMAKSMLHFLIGTLVDEGRLDPDQLAPVPEWADHD